MVRFSTSLGGSPTPAWVEDAQRRAEAQRKKLPRLHIEERRKPKRDWLAGWRLP